MELRTRITLGDAVNKGLARVCVLFLEHLLLPQPIAPPTRAAVREKNTKNHSKQTSEYNPRVGVAFVRNKAAKQFIDNSLMQRLASFVVPKLQPVKAHGE